MNSGFEGSRSIFRPQAVDVRVHGVLVPLVVVAPDLVEQPRAVEHLSWMPGEVRQQIELPGGQDDLAPADPDPALAGLDPERTALDGLVLARRAGRGREGFDPTKERLHPRLELAHAERLGEVVVRAHLESEHPVELGRLRGQHQDGNVAGKGSGLRGTPRVRPSPAASGRAPPGRSGGPTRAPGRASRRRRCPPRTGRRAGAA